MKKVSFIILGIFFLTCNLQGQSRVDKLCKIWHMDRTITLYENAYATNIQLGDEYRLSYKKFDCKNMTFAYNGLSKQADGTYKEYYVHTGSWKLIDNDQRLVMYNKSWNAGTKEDIYFIISLTDSELILMSERQFNKDIYIDGKIGTAFIWVYFCDKNNSK